MHDQNDSFFPNLRVTKLKVATPTEEQLCVHTEFRDEIAYPTVFCVN